MDHLRHADAKIEHATHPTGRFKRRMNRYNPAYRWRLKKNKVAHPVDHQKRKAKRKLNHMNPLFYLRRIKNNLMSIMRRKH